VQLLQHAGELPCARTPAPPFVWGPTTHGAHALLSARVRAPHAALVLQCRMPNGYHACDGKAWLRTVMEHLTVEETALAKYAPDFYTLQQQLNTKREEVFQHLRDIADDKEIKDED